MLRFQVEIQIASTEKPSACQHCGRQVFLCRRCQRRAVTMLHKRRPFSLSLSLSPCQSLNFKRRLKNKKDKRDYTHSVSQNAELARCRISKSITFASDHLQDRASVVVVAFSEWPPDVLIDFSVIFTSGSIKSSNNWPVQLPNAA